MIKNIKKDLSYPIVISMAVIVIIIQSIIIYQGSYINKLQDVKQKTVLQLEMARRNEQLQKIQKDLDDSMYRRNQQMKDLIALVKHEMGQRNSQLKHIQSGVHHLNGLFGIKCAKSGRVPEVTIYKPNIKIGKE